MKKTTPLAALFSLAVATGCGTQEGQPKPAADQPVRVTLLHTSDIHSRLLPYDLQIMATDKRLIRHYAPDSPAVATGTGPLVQMGGAARMATLIKRERARGDHVLWIDTGDPFQGAPIFNVFSGEPEFRFLSYLGVDVMTIGNHEFDKGLDNLARMSERYSNFPMLCANYVWERDVKGAETMARLSQPYTIVHANGLKIGIIGMGDLSSLSSIGEGTNSLGITPLDEIDTLQFWINYLSPQVDVVGLASHLGLTGHGERKEDYEVIDGTVGLDFVLGGHLHVVLDPPQVRHDKAGRPVVLAHSGAFMKYLGKLELVFEDSGDPVYKYEVKSHAYNLIPVDESVPEDPDTIRFIEPYVREMNRQLDLTRIIAYAPLMIPRFGREKAGSELGNISAEAMADRRGVQADFALTNTLGVRTDIVRGPITSDQLYNVFPFDNYVTKLFMSGREICEMMTFVARRSSGRGCQTQAQFSDRIHLKLNCVVDVPECSFASEVAFRDQERYEACKVSGKSDTECDVATRVPIDAMQIYEVAVNDYIAGGGSGFRVLKFNATKQVTDISIREAVISRFQSYPTCAETCVDKCVEEGGNPAECAQLTEETPAAISTCQNLSYCYEDVAKYHDRFCKGMAEVDPRDFCLEVTAAFKNVTPSDPAQLALSTILQSWCRTVAAQGAKVPAGEVMPDDCFVVEHLTNLAAQLKLPLMDVAEGYNLFREQYGIPAISERCECLLEARAQADAECRTLPCVEGYADDRLETAIHETYDSAREAFSGSTDLCAVQALTVPCDPEDLDGIEQDDQP